MEPVTTFALTVALLGAVPATQRSVADVQSGPAGIVGEPSAGSSFLAVLPGPAMEATRFLDFLGQWQLAPQSLISPQELLKREVAAYRDLNVGWNGPDFILPSSRAIDAALAFLERLPSRLPLPRPMLSHDGELGLYWDLVGGYAEVSFDPDGTLTYFSRAKDGEERFQEGVAVSTLGSEWYWESIGSLDHNVAAAA
jgi:hypothetical protein